MKFLAAPKVTGDGFANRFSRHCSGLLLPFPSFNSLSVEDWRYNPSRFLIIVEQFTEAETRGQRPVRIHRKMARGNLMGQESQAKDGSLVILVHGTFARGAPWARMNSAFVRNLRARLGDGFAITAFDWSGRNSHVARETASDDLSKLVAKCP